MPAGESAGEAPPVSDTEAAAPMTRWTLFRQSPHLPALVVTLIVSVCAALFAASYSLAFGDPTPHRVPVAIVGDAQQIAVLEGLVAKDANASIEVFPFSSEADALDALDNQRIYGALVLGDAAGLTVHISSASGSSIARLLTSDASLWAAQGGLTATIVDAHPLPASDQSGLAAFYVTLAAIITGFMGAVQLRTNAAGMDLRRNLGWDVVRVVLGGLAVTLTVGPILQVAPFPVLGVWLVLSSAMLVSGLTYALFRVLVGAKWAMLPTWILFVLLGNPSSGGAVASQLLPPFFETVGRLLPTSATVSAVRDLTYFPDHLHSEPFLVLGAWLVGSLTLYVVARVRRYGASARAPRQ